MKRYQSIQRICIGEQTTIEAVMEAISGCPDAWDSVMLISPGDLNDSEEVSKAKWEIFAGQVEAIKKSGLPVMVEMSMVLGHGDVQLHRQGGFQTVEAMPRYMVGPEGETAVSCVCPRSEELKRRLSNLFSLYARLDEESIWIDDDFRVHYHPPVQNACFCDACMAEFNGKYGYDFTREELNREILADHYPEENTIRRQWLQFAHNGMVELLMVIEKAVHSVNPDMIIGLMNAGAEFNIADLPDFKEYLRTLANRNGKVYFRPGCMAYDDRSVFEVVEKAFSIAVSNEHAMIEGARSYSEFVICPYVKRAKSHKITAWEAALHIGLGGADGVTYEATQNMIQEMKGYIACIHQEQGFLAALAESLAGHKQVGFYPYFSKEQWVYADAAGHMGEMDYFPYRLPRQLIKIGVPLTPSPENALGVILAGNTVKSMSEEELQIWLGKGVYADARAASLVQEKLGYPAMGVEILGPVTETSEVFTEDELNGPYGGFRRCEYWDGYGVECADMSCAGARALSVSAYPRICGQEESPLVGTAVYETPQGGKAAVLARMPWSDDIMSFPKSCQILNIMDWLCDGVPVRIDTDCRIGQALWQGEEDLVCFLFSMDYDDAQNIRLQLKAPARAERLGKDGVWYPVGEGSEIVIDRLEAFTCAPIRLIR